VSDKRVMSEMFRQDDYPPADQYPLPRPDPRHLMSTARSALEDLRKRRESNDQAAALIHAAQVDPGGQLTRDAGIYDIAKHAGHSFVPERGGRESGLAAFNAMAGAAGPSQYSTVDPVRFSQMLESRPESPNAVWAFDDRFRGM
jgi:hypothetical protein